MIYDRTATRFEVTPARATAGGSEGPRVTARRAAAIHHRVLGLPTSEADPVRIITAAQVRLRRWRQLMDRRAEGRGDLGTFGRVRRIIQARDALLQQTSGLPELRVSSLANRSARPN